MTSDLQHELLSFVAAHELVIAQQAAALLKITEEDATHSLAQLGAQRWVSSIELASRRPVAYRITSEGADLVDSALPPLRALSWSRYRHEIAVPWLWAAARDGNLGELREVLSRRQMQAADATHRTQTLLEQPHAVFAEQPSTGAPDPRHAYPDLGLVQADHGWVPLTVVLTPPRPEWLRTMVSRLNRDPLMRGHLYLVEQDAKIEKTIKTIAAELGVADRVHVQRLAQDAIAGA